ncbi:MAG: sigma-70 family RNA polymerase sigma factor [Prevotella sp.]|nr:sigma-70 family RNA polymerase sigma factor [Prevotella sp.]
MVNKARNKEIEDCWDLFLNSAAEEIAYQNFAAIYDRCIDDLLAYGISMGFDEDTCRDAAQDVFCNLFIKRRQLQDVGSLTAYLFRSFRNDILNAYKKTSKFADFDFSRLPFTTEVTVLDRLISDEERALIKSSVETMLNQLTPRQREAIYLRYMQNMDYDEIATLLGMNAGSVRKLVYRSIRSLRRQAKDSDNPLALLVLLWILTGPA